MYYLKFQDLWNCGHALSFPCNDKGEVNLDEFSKRMKENYYFVRTMIGKQYSCPILVQVVENE